MSLSSQTKWGLAAVVVAALAALWAVGGTPWDSGAGGPGAGADERAEANPERPDFDYDDRDWEVEAFEDDETRADSDEKSDDDRQASEEARPDDGEEVVEREEVASNDEASGEPVVAEETTSPTRRVRPGQQGSQEEREQYHPAVLRVVTNFDKADVTVNGIPYPEYIEDEDEPGMVLPAGGPYTVQVTFDGKTKTYTISLEPYRHRVLMVELSGFKGGGTPPSARSGGDSAMGGNNQNSNKDEDGQGRVTVYSKPKGTIHVDGNPRKQKTPGTIKVPAGRHDIQVNFATGEMSESKTVRVREGSRIKLFFRKKDE